MKKKLFLFLTFWGIQGILFAQATAPQLRIETGMHTALIWCVATDANSKCLLTCSLDKTARLWDVNTGRLLRTIRIPIESGYIGHLYACALSQDGRIAALGGWTQDDNDEYCIYIVNTQTAEIVETIRGIPNVIESLCFSANDDWLAAGIGGSNGVFIINTRSWVIHKKLTGYEGRVHAIAFSHDNQFASACYNGKLRLYNENFALAKEVGNLAGKTPRSIAFNRTGNLLAVAYSDTSTIEVRYTIHSSVSHLNELSVAYLPAVNGIDPKFLSEVTFSADGQWLYAGGSLCKYDGQSWKYVLRKWSNSGKGRYIDLPVLKNTFNSIKSLQGGRIAVCGGGADIAVMNSLDTNSWYKSAYTNRFAAVDKSHFRISASATSVGFTTDDGQPLIVDILLRRIELQSSIHSAPTDAANGTIVTDWNQSIEPKINGIKTSMKDYERSLSVDVSHDGKKVAVGADWTLYLYSHNGTILWSTPTSSEVFAVNISGNMRTVVATLGDGTIRWYSAINGKELLAFFLHPDKKRWVMFTPHGYYDAAPGADELIGWHINNELDKAPDFYPISRFRSQYYRPDIVDAVLKTYDEDSAIALTNETSGRKTSSATVLKSLPPTILITSPESGSEVNTKTTTVRYRILNSANAPVTKVTAQLNGRPVSVEVGKRLMDGATGTIYVPLQEGENTVTLLAENEAGTSPEANLYITYKPAIPKTWEPPKPRLYVLAIGINDKYPSGLKYAAADATDFTEMIVGQKGLLYSDVEIKLMVNENASREKIADGMEWIQKQTGTTDIAMIFYAGHGTLDNTGNFYYVPFGGDANRAKSTCLNAAEMKQTVSGIAGKVALFVDACHSGSAARGMRDPATDINRIISELASTENGAYTFTSSTAREYSIEDPKWGHGAFTYALLEGMRGKAAIPGTRKITVGSLNVYVTERVKELTNGRQHATGVPPPNVPDFPICIIK